jgi:putative ABC transport system permease protein
MLKNYLTVAFRNLSRNKAFSAINILGLAIGISSALVIYLIVHYDFSFDRFEPDGDRIYRVVTVNSYQGSFGHTRSVPAPLGEAIHKELSGIEETVTFRYYPVQKTVVPRTQPGQPAGPATGKPAGSSTVPPSSFKAQSSVIFADGHYLNLLPFQWLAGSPRTALTDPGHVVLDQSRATLYFPGWAYKDIIGQKVLYDDTIVTSVSGIVADLDTLGNTTFNFKEFISLPTLLDNKWLRQKFNWDEWGSITSDHQVYVRLAKGSKPATIEAGLASLFNKYQGADARKYGFKETWLLQPLQDIHFNSNYGVLNGEVASKSVLYGLMLVSAFLLLLGCINFVNLTTAKALQRAKEIGIRKTMGSSRWQLIFQFLCETFVITLLATALSILMTPLLLKAFADFIPKDLHFSLSEPYLLGFGVVLVLVVSFLAGFYPALVLSSWQPVKVLKSQVNTGSGGLRKARVRQSLTVLQFVIAQAFVMATLLVSKQISFLLNRDLGFHKEAILSFGTSFYTDTSYRRRLYFVHELQQIPGVTRVSLASDVPSSGGTWGNRMTYQDGKKKIETAVEIKCGDTNYLPMFHIPLLAGRAPVASDTIKEMLINETYLHILGFQRPQDILGKTLDWGDNKPIPIVGVMKDFYAHALDDVNFKMAPMAFSEAHNDSRQIIVSLPPIADGKTNWKPTIAQIEARYKAIYPGEEFDYSFFDESIAGFYDSEQRIARLLNWATGITIFISCLGLLGLVIYTTQQRVKEIGVRKVLGASVTNIVSILSKEFIKLVIIAFVLATPVAWWALHEWLNNFAVRTDLSWWVFALSGVGMITIAMITLGIQTIRAANANPINSLRTE